MRKSDLEAIGHVIQRMPVPGSVLVFSPAWDSMGNGCSERALLGTVWPDIRIEECDKGRWDLDDPMPGDMPRCDVGLICNTFICSRDPALWLRNISAAVDVLVIQDLAVCRREEDRQCSMATGDVARYSVSSHGIIGETDPDLAVFDLSSCGYEVSDVERYEADGGLKFVAVLRMV